MAVLILVVKAYFLILLFYFYISYFIYDILCIDKIDIYLFRSIYFCFVLIKYFINLNLSIY